MDFSAWFEVFIGGKWFTFDARHNRPRIGRIVIARVGMPPTSRSQPPLAEADLRSLKCTQRS